MYQQMVSKVKGGFNQVLYWSKLLDWKNQTLTPNPDGGPVVLEIPLADNGQVNGSLLNLDVICDIEIAEPPLVSGTSTRSSCFPVGVAGEMLDPLH